MDAELPHRADRLMLAQRAIPAVGVRRGTNPRLDRGDAFREGIAAGHLHDSKRATLVEHALNQTSSAQRRVIGVRRNDQRADPSQPQDDWPACATRFAGDGCRRQQHARDKTGFEHHRRVTVGVAVTTPQRRFLTVRPFTSTASPLNNFGD